MRSSSTAHLDGSPNHTRVTESARDRSPDEPYEHLDDNE